MQPSEAPEVFLANGFVDGCPSANSLSVVVGSVGPPIGLGLDVAQNHVFHRGRQPGHFPGHVGLPAPPRLGQMLQNRSRLRLLDT